MIMHRQTRWTRTRDLFYDLWSDAADAPNDLKRWNARLCLVSAFAGTILVGMTIAEWIAEVSV